MARRARREDDRTWGMKVTEFFLPFFGPASIRKSPPVPPTEEDIARDTRLRQTLERVTRPDGHVYLVERED
ncbi:hypothetical protein [Isoptericola sp. NPDC057653]|uniref:hypothetical protein n=1 Tax=unclassified Isoptericola TaxID=2623355 RepID=UPI00367F3C0B